MDIGILFIERKSIILILCMCLVQHQICSTELEEVSENVNNVIDEDFDYSAEEAAKEEILRNEQHSSAFSGRRRYGLAAQVMLENTPIWREFWNEWKEKKLTLRKSITDVKPLCKFPKNYKILVDCNSTRSSIFACVDAEKGTIGKCNSSRNAIYTVPLCMEISSRKIVACGKLATAYLCVPNITRFNDTKFTPKIVPIRPCHHEERQICLERNGFMDLCQAMFNTSLLYSESFTTIPSKLKNKDSEIFIQYNNLSQWWKEWDEHESMSEDVFKNLSILCRSNAEKEFLVECKSSSNLSEACIEARTGKIKQCSSIKKKDMPLNICVEESNKITSCEEGVFAFLCFSKYRNIKSISPCRDEHRHVCLNNGSIVLCSSENQTKLNINSDRNAGSEKFKISSNNSGHYNTFKTKNIMSKSNQMPSKERIDNIEENEGKTGMTGQNEHEKQITICRSRRNRVVFCNSSLAYSHLCVTAVRNVIGNCKSFNTTDKPMPVCVEESSKRIVICDDGFRLKYLCFEERLHQKIFSRKNKKIYYVYPCTWENKMRCLNKKGRLALCTDVHQISEVDIHGMQKETLSKKFQRSERSLMNRIDSNNYVNINEKIIELQKADDKIWREMTLSLNDTLSSSKRYGEFSKKEETVLCTFNGRNDTLIQCDDDQYLRPYLKACVNLRLGKIDDCQSLNHQDKPLGLCKENFSNKLKICDSDDNSYLCFQNQWNFANKKNLVLQCSDVKRHICVDKEEGLLHYCSMSGLTRITRKAPENNYSVEELFWIDYWMEWAHPDLEHSVKDPDLSIKLLCFAENNDLVECHGANARTRACTSASESYVGRCTDLSDSEKAVPICMERHSKKLITCGKFPRAYLCYPPDGHLKPKLPCHDESRHVCYTDGFIQNCLIADFYRARRQNRRMIREAADNGNYTLNPHSSSRNSISLLLENRKPLELRNDIDVTRQDFVFLCELDTMKYGECNGNTTARQMCLYLTLQKVGVCDEKENTSSVPICKDVFSNRIRTCVGSVQSFICIKKQNNYSIMHICNSSYDYVCLNETNGFVNCKNFTKSTQNYTESQTELESTLRNQIMQTDETMEPMELLCSTSDGKIILCIDDPYISVTCISTKNWNLLPCEEVEDNSEIGIPVCVQSNSSKLMTCDTFSLVTLCFSSDKNTTTLKLCERSSSTACVTNDGVLKHCSQLFDKTTMDSGNTTGEVMMFNLERNFEGIESLCFHSDKNELTPCSLNETQTSACFSSINGSIGPCKETNSDSLPIQICRDVLSKELITCGKFNKVNLCIQASNSTSYIPCASTHMYLCLDNGKIEKCTSNQTIIKTIRSVNSVVESDALNTQIDKNVYLKGFDWIKSLFQRFKPLCKKDIHLVLCSEETATSLACFGIESGKVSRCDDFSKSDIISTLYLDMKNKINLASRSIFKNYLCISEELRNIYACSKMNDAACLQNGSIITCTNKINDVERSTGYLIHEGFQERKNVSKEVSDDIQMKKLHLFSFIKHNDKTQITRFSPVVEPTDYEETEEKDIEYTESDEINHKLYNGNEENLIRLKRSAIKKLTSNGNEKTNDDTYSVVVKYNKLGNSKGYNTEYDFNLQKYDDNGNEDSYYTDNGDGYTEDHYFYDNLDDNYYYDDDYHYDEDYHFNVDERERLSPNTRRQNKNEVSKANLSVYVYICALKNNAESSQKYSTMINKNNITDAGQPIEREIKSDIQTIMNQTKAKSGIKQPKNINLVPFTDYNNKTGIKSFPDDIDPVEYKGIKDKDIKYSTYDGYYDGLNTDNARGKRSLRDAIAQSMSGENYKNYNDDISIVLEAIKDYVDGQTPKETVDFEHGQTPEETADCEDGQTPEECVDSEYGQGLNTPVDFEDGETPEETDCENGQTPDETVDREDDQTQEETTDCEDGQIPEKTVNSEDDQSPKGTDCEDGQIPEESVDSEYGQGLKTPVDFEDGETPEETDCENGQTPEKPADREDGQTQEETTDCEDGQIPEETVNSEDDQSPKGTDCEDGQTPEESVDSEYGQGLKTPVDFEDGQTPEETDCEKGQGPKTPVDFEDGQTPEETDCENGQTPEESVDSEYGQGLKKPVDFEDEQTPEETDCENGPTSEETDSKNDQTPKETVDREDGQTQEETTDCEDGQITEETVNSEDCQTPEMHPHTSTENPQMMKKDPTVNSVNENDAMDEKFMRIICNNCSIDNALVVVGTPEDVLPEAEVITFSP